MVDQDNRVFEKSKYEYTQFNNDFKYPSLDPNNYLSFYPEGKYIKDPEHQRETRNTLSFYDKYKDTNIRKEGTFHLEEELTKHIKNWIRTRTDYSLTNNKRDEFYNEEYVNDILFESKYFNTSYSIVNFELIQFTIEHLEKKMFDYILLQQWTYKDEKNLPPIKAPSFTNGFIELLIKSDIEEKLNQLYQDKSLGYTYIAEKIITLDLFIIYVILKNYPFYILTRSRLENVFTLLKKFKSWPIPIGSVGMDIFQLLINELYLPGVSIVNTIREKYMLDIIDPKTKDIYVKDFNRVISFDKDIYYLCDYNNEYNKDNIKGNSHNNNVYNLAKYPHLTFAHVGVYISYILYANEVKKDNDREEQYIENILNLYEKKFKQNKESNLIHNSTINHSNSNISMNSSNNNNNNNIINNSDDKDSNIDISEKNIINNLFNLIDNGLSSPFEKFASEVKNFNDKLILKAKETHDSKGSKPRDLINLRRFLEPKIKYIDLNTITFNEGINHFIHETDINTIHNNNKYKVTKTLNNNNNSNMKNVSSSNDEYVDKDELMDKDNIEKINFYKRQRDYESRVVSDIVMDDYINNFITLKRAYFSHLKPFKIEEYKFSLEKEKKAVLDFNKTVKIKEKILSDKYTQQYIIPENLLPKFISKLPYWKANINAVYHTTIYNELKLQKENNSHNKKENIFIYNELEKQREQNKQERLELENVYTQTLNLNYQIYLIPERRNTDTNTINRNDNNNNMIIKYLSKFISKKDFIYKTTICDFYLSYKVNEQIDKQISEIVLKLYLNEAKHNYKLKVFKVRIVKDNGENGVVMFYGSVHVEMKGSFNLELSDNGMVYAFNAGSNSGSSSVFMDVINIYDENSACKVNGIEKYLVDETKEGFQIFVGNAKGDLDAKVRESKGEDYFKRFVVNLLDFDAQVLNLNSKCLKVNMDRGKKMKVAFTFMNVVYEDVIEIGFDFDNREEINIATFVDTN